MSKLAIIALDEGSMTAGSVANIIEIASDTALGINLPLDQLSWDCGQYPVAIGDRWEDGVFSLRRRAAGAGPDRRAADRGAGRRKPCAERPSSRITGKRSHFGGMPCRDGGRCLCVG